MKSYTGMAVALLLFVAFAGIARADGTLTTGVVLDSLNEAHKKFDAGDKPGAKADLTALGAKLKESANPLHKKWRRQVSKIVLELTVGLTGWAEGGLHALIKEVSSSGSEPPAHP